MKYYSVFLGILLAASSLFGQQEVRPVGGTAANAIGKAEDSAHASGHIGTMCLAVRTDAPVNRSGTDGDYEPVQVSEGLVWSRVRGLQTPNGDSCLDDTLDAVKVVNATAANFNALVSQTASTVVTVTLQSAATANGNGTVLNTTGMSSAVLTVNCASCSGGTTINFEGRQDATNYTALSALQIGTSTIATTTTAAGITHWRLPVANLADIRARISAYSVGTITITGTTSPMPWNTETVNANATVTSFPDNEPFNMAQINGVTPLMGAGNTGTGSPRTTQATDQAALAAWGHGATGAAPPTGATQVGGKVSGATGGLIAGPIFCDNFDSGSITANTQIVTGVSGRRVYFCSFWTQMNAGANTVAVVAGTGTVCATNTVRVPGIGPDATAANSFSLAANSGIVLGGGANSGPIGKTSVDADNVCVFVGTATRVVWGASWAIL